MNDKLTGTPEEIKKSKILTGILISIEAVMCVAALLGALWIVKNIGGIERYFM